MQPAKWPSLVRLGLLPLALIAGIWLGGHPSTLPHFVREQLVEGEDFRVVSQALDRVAGDYYRRLPDSQLVDSAIAGAIGKLGDRYSSYLDPKQYHAYIEQSDSQFSGVGLSVTLDPLGLRVVRVFDRSPAARAGIRIGDRVVAVDGRSLKGVGEATSTDAIKGRSGTRVSLGLRRGARGLTVTVTRAAVSVPVVQSREFTVAGRRLAAVALGEFSSGAHGELRQAVDSELSRGARGLVLDLRGNGGGLVSEARLVASIFVAHGTIVVTRGRARATETLSATGGAIASSIPVVVLVDRATASAAEIVTGALQDHHRALVVGTHTYGKGVFQEVLALSNGGALDITVGEYYTPAGRNLGGGGTRQGVGIAPDVAVRAAPHARGDQALRVALRTLAAAVK